MTDKFKEEVLRALAEKDTASARRLLAPQARGYMERGEPMPQDLEELLALYLATDMLNPV
ncbi:MAG: hypothetical protein PW734_11405 [Verrucomicrobium sp.]|nr:hypothetical protein [Verrucomicrobium sp.]